MFRNIVNKQNCHDLVSEKVDNKVLHENIFSPLAAVSRELIRFWIFVL